MRRFVTVIVQDWITSKSAQHTFVIEDNPDTDIKDELYKAYRIANSMAGTTEEEHKELPSESGS